MTSLLPPDHQQQLAAAATALDELCEAGDYEAIAWNLIALTEYKRAVSDLHRAVEDALVEIGPWSGKVIDTIPGLPVLELRGGSERKKWDWDGIAPLLVRSVLDPEATGEAPPAEVVEAVEELAALYAAVVPMTPSNGPRVRAVAPILKAAGHDVDEFCSSTPARQAIQIHEGTNP